MLTEEKICVYRKYEGDLDYWTRMATAEEKSIISDEEWFLIDELLQEIKLLQSNMVSNSLIESIEIKKEKLKITEEIEKMLIDFLNQESKT